MGVRNQVEGAAFADAVDAIANASLRPEVVVDEIPAPQRIAPFAHAISGDVMSAGGDDIGTGRFILLHDPAGNDAWDGTFRCVTFARADIEADMAADPVLAERRMDVGSPTHSKPTTRNSTRSAAR